MSSTTMEFGSTFIEVRQFNSHGCDLVKAMESEMCVESSSSSSSSRESDQKLNPIKALPN